MSALSDPLRLGGHPDPEASEASVEPTLVPRVPARSGRRPPFLGTWATVRRQRLAVPSCPFLPLPGETRAARLERPAVQARSVLEGVPGRTAS